MGLVPAAHKALGKRGPFVYLLELDLPGGMFRCSLGGYNSVSEGSYPGLIERWSPIVRDASDATGKLAAVECNVTINDQDQTLSKLKEGPLGDQIRGSAARAYRAHPSLLKADWLPIFTGVVATMGPLRTYSREFTLRVDDKPLTQDIPAGWSITRADWTNADPGVLNVIAPWIYGKHSSLGIGDKGIVPTFYVDIVNFIFLVSAGYLKSVDAVYKAGVKLTLTADYTITYPVRNGRQFTCIDLVADPGTDAITCDVQGVEILGDGTGALLENRGKQISHLLNQLVWSSYESGAYQYMAAPLHFSGGIPLEYAQDWFDAFGITGSRHLFGNDGGAQALAILDEWCESADMRAYWTALGKLNARPIDHRLTDIYSEVYWLRQDEGDEIGDSFSLDDDDSRVVDNVVIDYLLSAVEGRALYTLEVGDTLSTEGATETMTDHWAAAVA